MSPIAVSALVLALSSQPAADSKVPITVLSSSVDVAEETVTFTLRNDSEKAITAWNVWLRFDPEPRRIGLGSDSYRSFAGTLDSGSHIAAGGTITVTRRVPGVSQRVSIFPHVLVMPDAAIFADPTFAGDKRFADRTLEHRVKNAADLREVVKILEGAKATGTGTLETLERVRDQLDDVFVKDKDGFIPKWFGTNVRIFMRQVSEGTFSADQRLNFLLDQARRELAAAVAHSRRQ